MTGDDAIGLCAGGERVLERVGDGGACGAEFLFILFCTFLGGSLSDELEDSSELRVNTIRTLYHLEDELDVEEWDCSESESNSLEESEDEESEDEDEEEASRFRFKLCARLLVSTSLIEISESLDFKLPNPSSQAIPLIHRHSNSSSNPLSCSPFPPHRDYRCRCRLKLRTNWN